MTEDLDHYHAVAHEHDGLAPHLHRFGRLAASPSPDTTEGPMTEHTADLLNDLTVERLARAITPWAWIEVPAVEERLQRDRDQFLLEQALARGNAKDEAARILRVLAAPEPDR